MNEILMKRICRMIAMNYAISEELIWSSFLKLNSIDKILDLIKDNKFREIEKIFKEYSQ